MIIPIFFVSISVFSGSVLGELFYKNEIIGKYITYLAPIIPFLYFDCIVDAALKGIDKQLWVVIINITNL